MDPKTSKSISTAMATQERVRKARELVAANAGTIETSKALAAGGTIDFSNTTGTVEQLTKPKLDFAKLAGTRPLIDIDSGSLAKAIRGHQSSGLGKGFGPAAWSPDFSASVSEAAGMPDDIVDRVRARVKTILGQTEIDGVTSFQIAKSAAIRNYTKPLFDQIDVTPSAKKLVADHFHGKAGSLALDRKKFALPEKMTRGFAKGALAEGLVGRPYDFGSFAMPERLSGKAFTSRVIDSVVRGQISGAPKVEVGTLFRNAFGIDGRKLAALHQTSTFSAANRDLISKQMKRATPGLAFSRKHLKLLTPAWSSPIAKPYFDLGPSWAFPESGLVDEVEERIWTPANMWTVGVESLGNGFVLVVEIAEAQRDELAATYELCRLWLGELKAQYGAWGTFFFAYFLFHQLMWLPNAVDAATTMVREPTPWHLLQLVDALLS